MTEPPSNEPVAIWDVSTSEPPPNTSPALKSGDSGVLQKKETRPIKKKHIRFFLALILLLIIGSMAIIGSIHWSNDPTSKMQDLVVLMSPIMTLAAAVFAFYFTDTQKNK
jgi:hypothetical protein